MSTYSSYETAFEGAPFAACVLPGADSGVLLTLLIDLDEDTAEVARR
jgi:hypothetical protein